MEAWKCNQQMINMWYFHMQKREDGKRGLLSILIPELDKKDGFTVAVVDV